MLSLIEHFFGFHLSHALLLFLNGMDAEGDLDILAGGHAVDDVANSTGGEAVATNELGNVFVGENEAKAEVPVFGLADTELGLVGVLDEAESDKLEKIADLRGGFLHMS